LKRYFRIDRESVDSGWRLRLTPRDARMAAVVDRLIVTGDRAVARLVIQSANSGRTVLKLRDLNYPERLSPAQRQAFAGAR